MPECTCHGKNPDCTYCNGWGYIGDSVCPIEHSPSTGVALKSRDWYEAAWSKVGQSLSPAKKEKCPICGQIKRSVKAHIAAVHPKVSQ
jgi:hypothetical protein